jgi:hypothetical protein
MHLLNHRALLVATLCALAGATATASASDPWAALRRPLRVQTLAPGARCPATPARARNLDHGRIGDGVGTGPVYPFLGGFSSDGRHAAWIASKTLWAWPPALKTRVTLVLVRGRRLDRPGVMKFQLGPNWDTTPLTSELRIDTTEMVGSFGGSAWGATVTELFVRTPGCYELQLDTTRGSQRIVMDAKRD